MPSVNGTYAQFKLRVENMYGEGQTCLTETVEVMRKPGLRQPKIDQMDRKGFRVCWEKIEDIIYVLRNEEKIRVMGNCHRFDGVDRAAVHKV